ncbi:VOC family protein [Bosea sp. OK403]|uniref:VOC family protein n=1 Tax=Bosea sp. OK403 TaxID=1855286 RepID=UPI001FCD891D|nr:VOC family protein [Bosea sp. OK403]
MNSASSLQDPPNSAAPPPRPIFATDDIDARCERARAAGAEICMEPTDQPYGSRDFICKDPEGHIWCFGTYRPGDKPA